MKQTTLCYLERGNQYLMLHRVKKENDASHDKWIGVGGKCEKDESPDECMIREVKEETGLDVLQWRYRGIVTFISDVWPCEYMHLFTASDWSGEEIVCNEGDLQWIEKQRLFDLTLWEGDRIFLHLLMNPDQPFFSLKLVYHGEDLFAAKLDGKDILIGNGFDKT
jgi:8-oxo-dGTP diphosphatase